MIGHESIHLLGERFKEKWHSFCYLHSDFKVSLWWLVFSIRVWHFCLNCSCLLDELQVSDTVVKNEYLENWLAWGPCTVLYCKLLMQDLCSSVTVRSCCVVALLISLRLMVSPSLNFLRHRSLHFRPVLWEETAVCPSALQEALLECSGAIWVQ